MASKNNPISFRQKHHNVADSLWHAHYNYSSLLHDDLVIREIVKYTYQRQKIWVNQILIRRTLNTFYIIVYLYNTKLGRWVSIKKTKKNRVSKTKKKLFRYIPYHFEKRIQKMIREYCNIQDQQIHVITYDYKKIYNLRRKQHITKIKNVFRYFSWLKSYDSLIELVYISLKTQNTTAFSTCFAQSLGRTKNHKKMISFVRYLFKEYSVYFKFFVGFRIMLKGRLGGRLRAKKFYLQHGYLPLQTIIATIYYNVTTVYSKYGTFGFHIWLCFSNSKVYQIHAINNLKRQKKYYFENSSRTPIPYSLTSIPNLLKANSMMKIYPSFSEKDNCFFFTSTKYAKILKMSYPYIIFFDNHSRQKDFFLWNFLYHFLSLKNKKYSPLHFLNLLNYLVLNQENKYRSFLKKKNMMHFLFKKRFLEFKKNSKNTLK